MRKPPVRVFLFFLILLGVSWRIKLTFKFAGEAPNVNSAAVLKLLKNAKCGEERRLRDLVPVLTRQLG